MLHNYAALAPRLHTLPDWQAECVRTFIARISDPAFPCTFAKGAITRGLLHFAFLPLGEGRAAAWAAATQAMIAYAAIEKTPDPYRVLVLATDQADTTWEADDTLLWDLVHHLQAHDPEPGAPMDLEPAGTSVPFMGMPWFFNVNSPAAPRRASRDTTGRLAFIVQRTDSFAGLAPEAQHEAVRDGIRARIAPYDGLAASPALHGYAHNPEGYEWKQFHLPPQNDVAPPARCPYHAVARG